MAISEKINVNITQSRKRPLGLAYDIYQIKAPLLRVGRSSDGDKRTQVRFRPRLWVVERLALHESRKGATFLLGESDACRGIAEQLPAQAMELAGQVIDEYPQVDACPCILPRPACTLPRGLSSCGRECTGVWSRRVPALCGKRVPAGRLPVPPAGWLTAP